MADGSIKAAALIAAAGALGAAYVASDPGRMKAAMSLVSGWTANAAANAPQPPKAQPLFPAAPPPSKPVQQAALSKNAGYGIVELSADGGGQYSSVVTLEDTPVKMLIDTGATYVSISYEDAERLNRAPKPADFTYVAHTANGEIKAAKIILREVRLDTISVRNVEAFVSERGVKTMPLLGMSFLKQLKLGSEDGKLVIKQQP